MSDFDNEKTFAELDQVEFDALAVTFPDAVQGWLAAMCKSASESPDSMAAMILTTASEYVRSTR